MADVAPGSIVYWDTSAVVSSLFEDRHSEEALRWSRVGATSLLSTLAHAETCAVIARLEREQSLTPVLAQSARHTLAAGPWRRLTRSPDWEVMDELSTRWPLRGADLWHLAAAATLRRHVPGLVLLSFDNRLSVAAAGLGFGIDR